MSEPDFNDLTPDTVINLIEETLDVRCTNICRPLNSYINRVYEVQQEDGDAVICKFYRPGRWSHDALSDEHDFLLELAQADIPAIAPMKGIEDTTLHEHDGLTYAIFPKKGGRICDEPSDDQWKELGRLLGRVHMVGAGHEPRDRITMDPNYSTTDQLDYILDSGLVAEEHHEAYANVADATLDLIDPLFEDAEMIRIHGDCHHQNLIYRPGESFFVIDFDDMAMGPPIQDIWMLLPGRLKDAQREMNLLLQGYETFRPMVRSSFKLIEPLRAMRYIHYTAWCIRQAADGGFKRLAPDWGTAEWWRNEVHELAKQQVEIQDALAER